MRHEQGARFETASEMLPWRMRSIPLRRWVPTTSKLGSPLDRYAKDACRRRAVDDDSVGFGIDAEVLVCERKRLRCTLSASDSAAWASSTASGARDRAGPPSSWEIAYRASSSSSSSLH